MRVLSLVFFLFVFSPALLVAAEIEPTICGSEDDARKLRTIAEGAVEVLAVCQKKGYFFVELLGQESEVEEFKSRLSGCRPNITEITDWISETTTGSRVLMVEYTIVDFGSDYPIALACE